MRTFSAQAATLFDTGNYQPYIKAWFGEEPNTPLASITPKSFVLRDTELEIECTGPTSNGALPGAVGNYITLERGIYVNGTPETVKTANFFSTLHYINGQTYRAKAQLLPDIRQVIPPDLTYSEVLNYLYIDSPETGNNLISPRYQFPNDPIWNTKFLPPGKGISFQRAISVFPLLQQKYLIFARYADYDPALQGLTPTPIYFYQPNNNITQTTIYPIVHWELRDEKFFVAFDQNLLRKFIWRDEYGTIHEIESGPIHNLGFLPSNTPPPKIINNPHQGSYSSPLKVDLRRESGDVFTVNTYYGRIKGVAQVEEYYDSTKSTPWWQIVRILKVYNNTEGGALPSTIERLSNYTPLNTTNFGGILSQRDNNLQAALETIDDHTHGPLADAPDAPADNKQYARKNNAWDEITLTSTHAHNWDAITGKPASYPPEAHAHDASDITSGTFANARIAQSNVTQHQAALSINWSQLTGVPTRREVLTANRTYFVRTNGNDANNGLSNTSGGAFASIQRAINVVATLDRSIYDVTIQVDDGTYNIGTAPIALKEGLGANKIYITGNVTTPSSVVIQSGALPSQMGAFYGDGLATQYEIKGFRFTGSSSYSCIAARNGTKLFFANCEFHSGFTYHIESLFGAIVEAVGNYSITGGTSNAHISARSFAGIRIQARTVTLTGTPAFAQFAECRYTAVIFLTGNTFSGSATGARYYADLNAVIQTLGATLPGNTDGIKSTGGQYV